MSLSEVIEIDEYEAFYKLLDEMPMADAYRKLGKLNGDLSASEWEEMMEDRRANEIKIHNDRLPQL